MFETFAKWLHDDTFTLIYSIAVFLVMLVPMLLLARWYHGNINKTAGGRRLMSRQNAALVGHRTMNGIGDAIPMMRDIAAGRYGPEAKRMQSRVYVVSIVWVLVVALMAGLMIAAQEYYPKPGANSQSVRGGNANR
jgi:hypothetical protein